MQPVHRDLASTYSIVAIDPARGEMGVAVQSHFFSVGSVVPWGFPGAGVVATQSLVNRRYGPDGLMLLQEGVEPGEIVRRLTDADEGRAYRQLAVLDAQGRIAAHTGGSCIREADHLVAEHYSVQANMMRNKGVPEAMARSFEQKEGPLARRLAAALHAAERAGGDIRGRQSAALLVCATSYEGHFTDAVLEDIRVDDHTAPLQELDRLLDLSAGYRALEEGDEKLSAGEKGAALQAYRRAEEIAPGNREIAFWHGVALLQEGERERAEAKLLPLCRRSRGWWELLGRLNEAGLADIPQEVLGELAAELGYN
jgi:uncharacterized Ntn-hydrolase superfamily protein